MRRLCGEGSRSYLGRSRLVPERATVMSRSEKSAEAVVVAAGYPPGKARRRAEREGQSRDVPLGEARHQEPGAPGRTDMGRGEAASHAVSDEAEPARRAQRAGGPTTCWAGAGLVNFSNRPVRTRMPGGVGGVRPAGRPLSRLAGPEPEHRRAPGALAEGAAPKRSSLSPRAFAQPKSTQITKTDERQQCAVSSRPSRR